MRSGDQTFIGPICTHALDVVELALEGGIELGIWREHALCLAIDKAVPQRPQEPALCLRLLIAVHNLAEDALCPDRTLSCGHEAPHACTVIRIARTVRVEVRPQEAALLGHIGRRRVVA
jgi:hypothetical protein